MQVSLKPLHPTLAKQRHRQTHLQFICYISNVENDELTELYKAYVESGFDVDMARDYLRAAEKTGDVVYKKPLEDFRERDERDLFAHVALHRHGIKFTSRAEDAPDGYSNIDLKFRASLWELKSPTAQPREDGKLKFIESNIVKAIRQFKHHYPEPIKHYRIVFSNRYTGFDDDFVLEELKKELKKRNVEVCLFIDKMGNVTEIW